MVSIFRYSIFFKIVTKHLGKTVCPVDGIYNSFITKFLFVRKLF